MSFNYLSELQNQSSIHAWSFCHLKVRCNKFEITRKNDQKLIVPLVYFCFCCLCFQSPVQKIVNKIMSRFYLDFVPRVWWFKIFVNSIKQRSNFILLHEDTQFLQYHLLGGGKPFSHGIFLAPWSNISWSYVCSLFLGS